MKIYFTILRASFQKGGKSIIKYTGNNFELNPILQCPAMPKWESSGVEMTC